MAPGPMQPPPRPGYHYVIGKGYVKNAPKATVGDGVRPGSVKSPVAPLKLPGSLDVKQNGMHVGTINVTATQKFLQSKGYDIHASGQMDKFTKAALADFLNPAHVGGAMAVALHGTHITGTRNPSKWNQLYGTNATHAKAFKPGGTLLDKNGNDPLPSGGSSGQQTVNYKGINQPKAGYEDPNAAAATGAKLFDLSAADAMAGEQYDPQIHDENVALAQNPRDRAQALADIKNWMGQVLSSENTAAARDKSINQAGVASLGSIGANLVASLGGGANAGSAEVAGSAADNAGTLGAIGANQDMYHSDLASILGLEKEGQLSSADAKFQAAKDAILQRLVDLKGQRGQAVTNARTQLQDKNNSILDNRLQYQTHANEYNDAQGQQQFNNRLALNTSITNSILANARVIAAGNRASAPAKGTFLASSANDKNKAAQAALSALTDANGKLIVTDPVQQRQLISAAVRSYGWDPSNPAVANWIGSSIAPLVGTLGH